MTLFRSVISILLLFLLLSCSSKTKEKEPVNVTIYLKADSSIMVNNKKCTTDNLDSLLESYDSKIIIKIKAENNVKMGFVNDVHKVLKSLKSDILSSDIKLEK